MNFETVTEGFNHKRIFTEEQINYIIEQFTEHQKPMTQIAEEFNIKRHSIRRVLLENNIDTSIMNGINKKVENCTNSNFFDIIDTEEKAYWLGFMYADGYISRNKDFLYMGLSISESDKSHLIKLKDAIGYKYEIRTYTSTGKSSYKGSPYCRLLVRNDNLCNGLIKNGCVEHKTLVLKFPTEDQVPAHLYSHFIRGYFDGDGCLTGEWIKEKYFKMFMSFVGTKEILDGIKYVLGKDNLKLLQRHPERNNNNYTLNICGNVQCMKFLEWMYADANVYLDRKYNRYIEYKNIVENKCRAS